jgi:hypothetical protein
MPITVARKWLPGAPVPGAIRQAARAGSVGDLSGVHGLLEHRPDQLVM